MFDTNYQPKHRRTGPADIERASVIGRHARDVKRILAYDAHNRLVSVPVTDWDDK